MRYLSGTSDYKLEVKKIGESQKIRFEVYTDADRASENADRNSVNAALMCLNGMLISWHCNKQSLVGLLTTENEFVSAARGIQEAMGCYHLNKGIRSANRIAYSITHG